MKILFITNRIPYPAIDGATKATSQLLEFFVNQGIKITLFALDTSKHPGNRNSIPMTVTSIFNDIDNSIKPLSALKALLQNKSYNISRFDSPAIHLSLRETLQKERFDLIHFENLYVSPYLPTVKACTNAPCILRMHNIEHQIWQRLFRQENNPVKKAYLKILSNQLKTFEEKTIKKFEGHLAISNKDQIYLKALGIKKSYWLPYCVEEAEDSTHGKNIGFIGSMDWPPNIEAVEYLLREIWPLVWQKNQNSQLLIAGRKMPDKLLNVSIPGVSVLGEIERINDFYDRIHTLAIPLLSGGGMRIKMIEAMQLGKAVVSTPIGAEGILEKSSFGTVLSALPDKFAEALIENIQDKTATEAKGIENKKFVQEHFLMSQVGKKLIDYYRQFL